MINFSQLIVDHPDIQEIDNNPLISSGDDIIAVDARVFIDKHPKKTNQSTIQPLNKTKIPCLTS